MGILQSHISLDALLYFIHIVLILWFTSPISQFLRNIKVNLYIIGFLANPVMKMEAKRRHETIQGLLNITFLETVEPITVNYSLSLSSEIVNARSSQIIRWDRKASKFFAQKLDWSSGYKNFNEYATCFSDAISRGVLWENSNHIGALSELIKLAFMLKFDEEVVTFLMKSKNSQLSMRTRSSCLLPSLQTNYMPQCQCLEMYFISFFNDFLCVSEFVSGVNMKNKSVSALLFFSFFTLNFELNYTVLLACIFLEWISCFISILGSLLLISICDLCGIFIFFIHMLEDSFLVLVNQNPKMWCLLVTNLSTHAQ